MNEEVKPNRTKLLPMAVTTLAIVIAICVLFIFSNRKDVKEQLVVIEKQKIEFTQTLSQRDSLINESLMTLNEIETQLQTIKEKQNLLEEKSEDSLTLTNKQKILKDINYLSTTLDKNKKKIGYLSIKLKESGIELQSLQDKISKLEFTVQENEKQIVELKDVVAKRDEKIAQLDTIVIKQQNAILQKDDRLSVQQADLNRAFYTCGTSKNLQSLGVISKEGGFLGLGKKQNLNFINNLYNEVDITETKTIQVSGKNAKIVTNHPIESYEFIRNDAKEVISLNIKDVDLFWKVSKYAIIVVK